MSVQSTDDTVILSPTVHDPSGLSVWIVGGLTGAPRGLVNWILRDRMYNKNFLPIDIKYAMMTAEGDR